MRPLALFFLLPMLLPLLAIAENTADLSSFFGSYRTVRYNGVVNEYSHRFFAPSINVEKSLKLKQETGEFFETFNLNFEVPLQVEGGIYLKFLFLEMPLNGSRLEEKDGGVVLQFSGRTWEELLTGWQLCEADYSLRLKKEENLQIHFSKKASLPCSSEEHEIEASVVN